MFLIDYLLIHLMIYYPIVPTPDMSPLQKSCPKVEIIDLSKLPWDEDDQNNLAIATKRCSQLFIQSPCLKKFIKKKKLTYNAICGTKE